ncbi:MAG: hypothetical protein IH897_16600 [Planctomycetes bacterium]|nr:hypothetical protein [Planctomycetota bacterium]
MSWTRTDDEKFKKRAINAGGGGNPLASNPGPVTGVRVLLPPGQIPTISAWGAVVMLLLVLAGGAIAFRHIRASTS